LPAEAEPEEEVVGTFRVADVLTKAEEPTLGTTFGTLRLTVVLKKSLCLAPGPPTAEEPLSSEPKELPLRSVSFLLEDPLLLLLLFPVAFLTFL
jgi:hypothetical protein